MYRRRLLKVTALGTLAVSVLTGQAAFAQPHTGPEAAAGPDGVEVFTGDLFHATTPLPEKVATALAAAEARVEAYPNDLGGAYVDRRTGQVVTTSVTQAGARIAAASLPGVAATPARVTAVHTNFATLRRIQHEAIGLDEARLPGSAGVYGTFVQPERNQVIVEAIAVTPAMRRVLADRYGVGRIAIHLTPGRSLPTKDYGGRQVDRSAYLGGALLDVPGAWCTSAFAWRNGLYHGMLTAGHCVANGGEVSSGVEYMGHVISNNWNDGVGTVKYPNDPYYRGDIGLVQIPAGTAATDARIYVGGSTSSLWRNVVGRFDRKSYEGDRYCIGGAFSGELCGFEAYTASYDVKYDSGEVAQNVTAGFTGGQNTQGGDSGGAVYTVDSSGQVHAKGIHSGHGSNWEYFTEITDAVNALPGDIATR